jgi:hypothetical protein
MESVDGIIKRYAGAHYHAERGANVFKEGIPIC